jgi:hypothetical protein
VSDQEVLDKMQQLLSKTGDFRTPTQAAQRLGITIKQLADMVNLKEIGNLAVDMCCSCGVYVLGDQPAVACEHCVVRISTSLAVCVFMCRICMCLYARGPADGGV